jgi:hypothetical protein
MPTRRQLDQQIQTIFFPEDGGQMGGISKEQAISRWVVDPNSFDDLVNFLPTGNMLQQIPGNGPVFSTLPSPAVWISAQTLNAATFIFALCANGAIYQTSLGGVRTIVTGPGTVSVNTDIANWQGTTILFTDLNASKIYSWDGASFATVFSNQPAQFITVFNSRLWMAYQATVTFTAGGTFNSLGGDSGSFAITDADCPPPIRCLIPFGGNLFIGGYSWWQTVGGLFDSGSPAVLQFSKTTLTDEAGVYSKWSAIGYGYSLYYASLYGVWSLLGAQPQFISDPVGYFFQGAVVPGSSYSAAYGQILGVPCLMWQILVSDGTYRVIGQTIQSNGNGLWFTVSTSNIAFITYGIDQSNGQQKVWATDTGGSLFQLFGGTGNVTSSLRTPLWSFGSRIRYKSILRVGHEVVVTGNASMQVIVQDQDLNQFTPLLSSVSPTTTFNWTNGGAAFQWTNTSDLFNWTTRQTQYTLMDYDMPITCVKVGMNTTITAVGAAILSSEVEYQELPADWGA